LTVALLIAQFVLGWLMPNADSLQAPTGRVAWHVGVGTSLLLVIALRLIWAALRPQPEPVVESDLFTLASTAVHMSLYALLPLVPVLGWLNASGRGWTVRLAGIFNLPQIATADSFVASLGEWHSESATILLIVVGLHIFIVVAHQLLFEANVLGRMCKRP
jgi:cytochrome b561